jgi:hypothetical protein
MAAHHGGRMGTPACSSVRATMHCSEGSSREIKAVSSGELT